jgi:hypothetical protein
VKTLTVEPKWNAVHAMLVDPLLTLVCPSSKKVRKTTSAVIARNEEINYV